MTGGPEPLGVRPAAGGVNVAVFSAHATAIEFCLFDGEGEVRRAPLRGRTGDVYHDHVPDVPLGARYGLRAHGPWAPNRGHRFNPAKLLIDPYALALDRKPRLHPAMLGADPVDSASFAPKAIVSFPPEPATAAQITPWSDTVLYELHVRGFTMRCPDIPPELRGRFAGLAHPAALQHLRRLGVTAVEIMPAAAWIEERHLAARGLSNYWGYNPVAFMAPDPGLAPGGWAEVRGATAALASAGIETILDVVLNHSGEGDAEGPTLSLRGLDNATWYRLGPGGAYIDDAGCGNVLALDRPPVLRLAMDALRAWALFGGVHGFRFDLATTLGRRADGFDPAAPLLQAIAQDPVLNGLKLIAEPWDVGPGGYRIGAFPAGWGEWNDRFRDDLRRFWRGDAAMLGYLATRLAGSEDLFAAKRRPSRSINFLAAHDGFTLADLVTYTERRNAANGEDGRDGTAANFSWNCGVEGETADPAIRAARAAGQRALLACLLLARGTPMLSMGAEFGHTQHGNNNAYAQDNETAWLDWANADEALASWAARLLAIRRAEAVLHEDRFLDGGPTEESLQPDVAWTGADGAAMTVAAWQAAAGDTLLMTLAGAEGGRVCLALHRGCSPVEAALPAARPGHAWRVLADSAAPAAPEADLATAALRLGPRSVAILAERRRGRAAADPTVLGRLAAAAGIAPEWWTVAGRRTPVSPDTQRALLAAMGLPAGTAGEARDSLRHVVEAGDRRALPPVLVLGPDRVPPLSIAVPPGSGPLPVRLFLREESGEIRLLPAMAGEVADGVAADGLKLRRWHVPLPTLPPGRHTLWRDDDPDKSCHVVVTPARCHLPAAFARGERRFGISAQLYGLRRDGDGGIGDLSTLGRLRAAAARAGGAAVAVNPLHMLFPNQRERASPSHPSDRRFLDPIYIDAGTPDVPGPLIDHARVWAAKRAALERRFADEGAGPALDAFVASAGPGLRDFARFQAMAEVHAGPWTSWPDGLRTPAGAGIAAFAAAHAERIRFHGFLQFLAERQLAAAASGLEIGLIRDLAVGAAPDGAEAWARQHALARGAWTGAPPDPFAADGQNWHLPPPLPLAMAAEGYAGFAELLAANMRHAGGLRIDHVMALRRLFWIPEGGSGADGAYVSYPFHDLLGVLALESARARCMVVGEDLGTVPDGLRPALADAGVLGVRVLLLEREGADFRPAEDWPVRAVACVSTHDLPPIAGWLAGDDIDERAGLGLLADAAATRAERAAGIAALAVACGEATPQAAHAFVARSPALLSLVQAEDLAGARRSVNVPGTDRERPNWRQRLSEPVETLLDTPAARAMLRTQVDAGRAAAPITGGTDDHQSPLDPPP
jgi:glycogen operon protein